MKTPPKQSLISFIFLHKWEIFLGFLILIYITLFSYLSLNRHWYLGSYYYDLGIMHQVLYNSSHGHLLELTDPNSTLQIIRFAIHFDPLMLIFIPFYWLYPHAEVLLIGQTIFLALGAIPLYLIACRIGNKVRITVSKFYGLLFAFLYLNYTPLATTNLSDFHAIVLVAPMLLWAFYFAEIKKYKISVIFLIFCLLGKENVSLVTSMLGLYYFFIKKQRSFGLTVFLVSLFSAIFVLGIIIPSQRTNLHFATSYFSLDVKTNLQRLLSFESAQYINKLLQPLGYLSLASPLYLLIAFPEWLINLLSKNANMRALQYHYASLIAPFVLLSACFGLLNIHVFLRSRLNPSLTKKLIYIMYLCTILSSLYSAYIYGYSSPQPVKKKQLEIIHMWENRLKNDTIPVSASGHLAPYFSGRRYFYNFFFDFAYENFNLSQDDIKKTVTRYQKADYVIIYEDELTDGNVLVQYYYNYLVNDKSFKKIFDQEEIEVYQKIKPL